MNTTNASLRAALARKTAALETLAREAVSLDAVRLRAENAQRLAEKKAEKAEKKTKRAMLLVKKVVKMLKAKRKARETEREESISPTPEPEENELREIQKRYKARGDVYLEEKAKLDADLLDGKLTEHKYRWKLGIERLDIAAHQQQCGWVSWKDEVDRDFWTKRKAECMAWHDKSASLFEQKYWILLVMATDGILDVNDTCAVKALLKTALDFMEDWGNSLGRD